jgi:SAM-dependent methyltransferase
MPDKIFENPRLVEIYDYFDGPRADLEHYLALLEELGAKSVLDVGCGTGSFACMLGKLGYDVIGLDPAEASLNFAQSKPYASKVRWILGGVTSLPDLQVDVVVMTGNVAQVFLGDDEWEAALVGIHRALRPGGCLVFEVRDPARREWLQWTREKTLSSIEVPGIGKVDGWCNVTDESAELVRFRWTYNFHSDGETITSDSTLRFRKRDAIEDSLRREGFEVCEVRDAPDRPGKEFVFIAMRS